MNLAELRRKLAALTDQARALLDTAGKEKRALSEDEDKRYNELLAEARTLQDNIKRLEELEGFTGVARPEGEGRSNGQFQNGRGPGEGYTRTADTPNAIFCRYLRTGDEAAANELRAYNNTDMNIGTPADGGDLVPTGFVQDIVARRDEMWLGPKLGITRVPGKGTTVNYPIDNEADVEFLTEAEAASIDQDAPAVTKKAFTLVKYAKHLTLSWELLRDEDAGLLEFIANWVARGWAATHNKALVTEVLANGTAGLTFDAAAAIGAAEIPELVGKLMPEYQDGAQWIMHPTTKAYIEGLNGDAFQFAPTPAGTRQSLWGYPNNTSSYMTALGASVKSVVFGNFNYLGYREGTGLTALRDPYSAAITGQVRLHYWFDLVYGVLQAEAIQYATHPSA